MWEQRADGRFWAGIVLCTAAEASTVYPVLAVASLVLPLVTASADPRKLPVVLTIVLAGEPLATFLNISVYLLFRRRSPAAR